MRQHIEEARLRGQESISDLSSDPQYARKATVADLFEHEVVGPFEDMMVVGEAWRAAADYARGGDAPAKKAEVALGARITGLASLIRGKSKFEPVALKRSAGVQLRALVSLMAWRLNFMGI